MHGEIHCFILTQRAGIFRSGHALRIRDSSARGGSNSSSAQELVFERDGTGVKTSDKTVNDSTN